MNENNTPDTTVITDLAKTAVDHALGLLKLVPKPIAKTSTLYKSLEEIRMVPLEANAAKGIQVNFNQDPETLRDCNPHPAEDVKSLESQKAARPSRSSTENAQISCPDGRTSHPAVKPDDSEYTAKNNADSLLGIPSNAIADGGYEKTDKFLRKADVECPSEMPEKLLQDVQIELYANDANKTIDNNNCDAGTKKKYNSFLEMENRAKAESLYNQAKIKFSNANFDEAMELAVKCQKLTKLAKTEVLKRDIIKTRNNHHSETNINTNTIDGNCNDDLNEIHGAVSLLSVREPTPDRAKEENDDEAVSLLVQAKAEMKNKNMKKAEQPLIQSIQIRYSESVDELLKEIRQLESEPKHEQIPTINSNYDEAQECMKVAEAAAKDKDFKKAEHFLEKSILLDPSTEAKEMLQNVRVYLQGGSTQANSESQQEVHNNENYLKTDVGKCIEVAMNAISVEDFEKAERFLKKAERIEPTEMAKELLEDVQEARQKMRLADEEKAVPLVCFAMTAIDEELFDIAEILLMNAWIKHKSVTAKNVIMQVKDIGRKKNKDLTPIQREISAKFIETARHMVSEGQLESAECVLIIAHNTYAINQAEELLTSIRYEVDFNSSGQQCRFKTKEWKFSKISNEGNNKRDALKCNSYVQMAQRAYETGDFNVAKAFLLEAENLYPTKDIKRLLELVSEAKKRSNI